MAKKPTAKSLVPSERIERSILLVRGHKVLLDSDLAELYGVETRVLNQAVARNRARFPEDFMFQLTKEELEEWRSQFVISNSSPSGTRLRSQSVILKAGRRQHSKYRPYAFTEQGVAMLSSVLRSQRAVAVNIEIMRAFVRLRELLSTHADLARRLDDLEKKYDSQFRVVFDAIRQLMAPPAAGPKRRIGFHAQRDD
jgi:hypothetical protein